MTMLLSTAHAQVSAWDRCLKSHACGTLGWTKCTCADIAGGRASQETNFRYGYSCNGGHFSIYGTITCIPIRARRTLGG